MRAPILFHFRAPYSLFSSERKERKPEILLSIDFAVFFCAIAKAPYHRKKLRGGREWLLLALDLYFLFLRPLFRGAAPQLFCLQH